MSEQKTKTNIELLFRVEARSVILSVILILLIHFAVNTMVYGWFNFLMNTAVVIGAGTIILIVYEASKGNQFEIPKVPTIDWKKGLRNVLLFCFAIALVIVGLFAIFVGFSYMMAMLLPRDPVMYALIAILFGIIIMAYADVVFGKLFKDAEEYDPKLSQLERDALVDNLQCRDCGSDENVDETGLCSVCAKEDLEQIEEE